MAKKKLDKTNKNQDIFIQALVSSDFKIVDACEETGLSRTQHYNWLENDEEYAQRVHDIKEGLLDFAESQLLKLMTGFSYVETTREMNEKGQTVRIIKQVKKHVQPSVAAIMFFLETKGKKRGYQKTLDIDVNHKTVSDTSVFVLKKVV